VAAPAVAARGEARRDKEAQTRARLRAGELGLDIYDLRTRLRALGVEWVNADGTPPR
jgi:4-hydroxy-4-methyl-2-oxoglutarate aldolase